MNTPLYTDNRPPAERSCISENTSGFQSAKLSYVTSESTAFLREDNNSKTILSPNDTHKTALGGLVQHKFLRLDSAPLTNVNLNDSAGDTSKISSNGEITPIRAGVIQQNTESNRNSSKAEIDFKTQDKTFEITSSVNIKRRRGSLWDSLRNLSQIQRKDSLSVDDSAVSAPVNDKARRRRLTVDLSSTLRRQDSQFKNDDNMKPLAKKPGTDFTLNHFKLLRKQIENEKVRLAKDIKEAVEEKERRG